VKDTLQIELIVAFVHESHRPIGPVTFVSSKLTISSINGHGLSNKVYIFEIKINV
jgi:hypothetical protein